MSIFGNILRKIFPGNHPAVTASTQDSPTSSSPTAAPEAPSSPTAGASAQPVDVEAVL